MRLIAKEFATNSRGPAGYLTNPQESRHSRQHLSTVEYSGQANQKLMVRIPLLTQLPQKHTSNIYRIMNILVARG